jgi:polysaccharide biosynthesis protein PslG
MRARSKPRRGYLDAIASAVLTLAVAVLALAAEPADGVSSAQRAPAGFVGMQAWAPPGERDFTAMRRAGVRSFRANVSWSVVEPTPGRRSWQRYDELFRRAALAGVEILPVLVGSPAFAARDPQYPPRRGFEDEYAAFVRAAVDRYGHGGSFWASDPALPVRPPNTWQVWNEPNLGNWWNGRPDTRAYVALLKLTRTAIRSEDRRAKIVLAGMPATAQDVQGPDFLRSIYAIPGAKGLFDFVAVHPYARDSEDALEVIARTRQVMRRARDRKTSIWVTEMGWGSRKGAYPPELSATERGQASLLRTTVAALIRDRLRYGIGKAFWFSWRDRRLARGERDWWAVHTGLFRGDGSPKPSWRAFRQVIRSGR